MRNLRDFEGVTGTTAFSRNGDAEKKLCILQIDGNKFVEFEKNPNKVLRLHILLGLVIREMEPNKKKWGYTLTMQKLIKFLPSEPAIDPVKDKLASALKERSEDAVKLIDEWFQKWKSFKNRVAPPLRPPKGCDRLQIVVNQINETATKGGNEVVFFLLPNENILLSQKNPLASANNVLINLLNSKGIKVVDLFEPFRNHYLFGGDGLFIDESAHLNAEGHRFVADLVSMEIKDSIKKLKSLKRGKTVSE